MSVEVLHIGWLGYVAATIVLGSLFLIILAAIIGKPWKPKVTLVFIGTIFIIFGAFVAATWLGGIFLSIFVP